MKPFVVARGQALRGVVPCATGVAIAAVTIGLALSAPLIWGAVAAGLGLFSLLAMAALGTLFFQALPLIMQKLETLPKQGERIEFEWFDVVVEKMEGARMTQIHVYPKVATLDDDSSG
jgi:hypothetical protein